MRLTSIFAYFAIAYTAHAFPKGLNLGGQGQGGELCTWNPSTGESTCSQSSCTIDQKTGMKYCYQVDGSGSGSSSSNNQLGPAV